VARSNSSSSPYLTLLRLMNDHTGAFAQAIRGVNTPELQVADNDYAVGLVVDKIAHSPYADLLMRHRAGSLCALRVGERHRLGFRGGISVKRSA
jgi:hypothetical protein